MIEHHPLVTEFPEHRERIHQLRREHVKFAELAKQYETLDNEVVRIEEGFEAASDERLENLKKNRLHLKDHLYAMLIK